ncbi:MAG: NmrA family NAD(P)-binding protein [Myxococcota bacterium]
MKEGRRIAVTGSTGYLGSNVARALAAKGHLIRALVRDKSRLGPARSSRAKRPSRRPSAGWPMAWTSCSAPWAYGSCRATRAFGRWTATPTSRWSRRRSGRAS